MAKYIDLLGILFYVLGGLQLLGGGLFTAIYLLGGVGLGVAGASSGDDEAAIVGLVMGVAGLVFGVVILVMAIPTFLAGMGVRGRKPWGRILAFIVAALSIMSFPFGTALGVFTFVVLLDKQAAAEFAGST